MTLKSFVTIPTDYPVFNLHASKNYFQKRHIPITHKIDNTILSSFLPVLISKKISHKKAHPISKKLTLLLCYLHLHLADLEGTNTAGVIFTQGRNGSLFEPALGGVNPVYFLPLVLFIVAPHRTSLAHVHHTVFFKTNSVIKREKRDR